MFQTATLRPLFDSLPLGSDVSIDRSNEVTKKSPDEVANEQERRQQEWSKFLGETKTHEVGGKLSVDGKLTYSQVSSIDKLQLGTLQSKPLVDTKAPKIEWSGTELGKTDSQKLDRFSSSLENSEVELRKELGIQSDRDAKKLFQKLDGQKLDLPKLKLNDRHDMSDFFGSNVTKELALKLPKDGTPTPVMILNGFDSKKLQSMLDQKKSVVFRKDRDPELERLLTSKNSGSSNNSFIEDQMRKLRKEEERPSFGKKLLAFGVASLGNSLFDYLGYNICRPTKETTDQLWKDYSQGKITKEQFDQGSKVNFGYRVAQVGVQVLTATHLAKKYGLPTGVAFMWNQWNAGNDFMYYGWGELAGRMTKLPSHWDGPGGLKGLYNEKQPPTWFSWTPAGLEGKVTDGRLLTAQLSGSLSVTYGLLRAPVRPFEDTEFYKKNLDWLLKYVP